MRKNYFILFFLLLASCRISAVPAKPEWRTFVQSDGSTIKVKLCGDENFNYYKTEDNVPLLRGANGDFYYAETFGLKMKSSGVMAHEKPLRSAAEQKRVSALTGIEDMRAGSKRNITIARKRERLGVRTKANPNSNTRHGLVIMVSFSDQDFSSPDSYNTWNDILNKKGYFDNGANGSVSDYFHDQSSGQFDITFDVVGPVKMPKSRYYYGQNDPDDNNKIDINVGELVVEACKAVDDAVDFRDYDWNGDGTAELVFVLFAGYCEAVTGADPRLIWPHQYYVSAYPQYPYGYTLDGICIDQYACGNELEGLGDSPNKVLSGLGTFCHEFSHCLGLPDFYTSSGLDMLWDWDLLSYGCYNGNGWCPAGYTAYEKMFCGWLSPVELDTPTTVSGLQAVCDGGNAFLIRNDCADESVDEYYLLENRQKRGWDAHIPGEGLLVTHVDYSDYHWYMNIVNADYSHPRMTLIPANGVYTVSSANAYPYGANDSLTDRSQPAAKVYNTNVNGTRYMGKPITNIKLQEGLVSFDFCGGQRPDGILDMDAEAPESIVGCPAVIYDVSGRTVKAVDCYTGAGCLPLRPGAYIVKSGNGNVIKVIRK